MFSSQKEKNNKGQLKNSIKPKKKIKDKYKFNPKDNPLPF